MILDERGARRRSAMKVLVLNGSPRPGGNTSRLVASIVQSAKESAAKTGVPVEIERYELNDLCFRGCQGCMKCKQESACGCALADDLTPVLKAMMESDAWVMGTPIYMGHVSGQFKLCLDRMYGFTGPNRKIRLPAGKKAVVAITQGQQNVDEYKSVADLLTYMLSRRGLITQVVVSGGTTSAQPGSAFNEEVGAKAAAAGEWLVAR